jgi:hypothetical protein
MKMIKIIFQALSLKKIKTIKARTSSAIVGFCWGLLPPKQHREREKLLCYSGPKSVRECAELSIGCDVITKGRVWGPSNGAFGALVKIYLQL